MVKGILETIGDWFRGLLSGLVGSYRTAAGKAIKDAAAGAKNDITRPIASAVTALYEQATKPIEEILERAHGKHSPLTPEESVPIQAAISAAGAVGMGLSAAASSGTELASLGQYEDLGHWLRTMWAQVGLTAMVGTGIVAPYNAAVLRPYTNYWNSQFPTVIPGTGELQRIAVREGFREDLVTAAEKVYPTPPDYVKWAAYQGLEAAWCRRLWYSHWDLPSTTQIYEMWRRGILPSTTGETKPVPKTSADLVKTRTETVPWLKAWLFLNDLHPTSIDALAAVSEELPTRVDIRRMYGLGIFSRDQVKTLYLKQGYSEENAEALTRFTESLYVTDPDSPLATERDLTKSEILKAYKIGQVTRDAAVERLVDLGYSEDEADFLVSLNRVQETASVRDLTATNITALYVQGVLERPEAMKRLAAAGYSQQAADYLLKLRELKAAGDVKLLPFGYLGELYKTGIITQQEYGEYLGVLGYPEREIGWVLELETRKKKK